jgi:hypothetical protein
VKPFQYAFFWTIEVLVSHLVHKIQEAAIRRAEGKFDLRVAHKHLPTGILEIGAAGGHEGTSGKHRSQHKEEKPRAGVTPGGTAKTAVLKGGLEARIRSGISGSYRTSRPPRDHVATSRGTPNLPALPGVRDVTSLGTRHGRAAADLADHSENIGR